MLQVVAGRFRGTPAPNIHRHRIARAECRDHGVSLEGARGLESPHHQPGAHLPEGATNGVSGGRGALRRTLQQEGSGRQPEGGCLLLPSASAPKRISVWTKPGRLSQGRILSRVQINLTGRELIVLFVDLADDVSRERPQVQIEGKQRDKPACRLRFRRNASLERRPKYVAWFRQTGNDSGEHFRSAKSVTKIAGGRSPLLLRV